MLNLIKKLFLKDKKTSVKQETESEKEITIKDLISAQMKYEENLHEIKRNNLNLLSEIIYEIVEIVDILKIKHLEVYKINIFSSIFVEDNYIKFFPKQLPLQPVIYFDRKNKIIENKNKVREQNSTKKITLEDKEKTITIFKQRLFQHFRTFEVIE